MLLYTVCILSISPLFCVNESFFPVTNLSGAFQPSGAQVDSASRSKKYWSANPAAQIFTRPSTTPSIHSSGLIAIHLHSPTLSYSSIHPSICRSPAEDVCMDQTVWARGRKFVCWKLWKSRSLKEAGGRKSSSEGSTVRADRSSVFFTSLLRLCVSIKSIIS